MPTYEYRCPDGHEFELFQKMSDDPVASCPECGKDAARRISGGAGFLFKGEGFYITDYRSDDYKKKASKESGKGDGGSGGSGDAAASGKGTTTGTSASSGSASGSSSGSASASSGTSSSGSGSSGSSSSSSD